MHGKLNCYSTGSKHLIYFRLKLLTRTMPIISHASHEMNISLMKMFVNWQILSMIVNKLHQHEGNVLQIKTCFLTGVYYVNPHNQ